MTNQPVTEPTQYPPGNVPAPGKRRRISRRGLLIGAGVGAVGLGVGGYAATRSPEITFVSGNYGSSGPKVLVAYDSAYGSTGEIAQSIAQQLAATSQVELRMINDGLGVSGYDAIVFGAPVQTDVMKKTATQWLTDRSADITMPIALFMPSASFGIDPDHDKQVTEKLGVLTDTADQAGLSPVGLLPCGGVVDFSKMSFATSTVFQVMSGSSQEGDFRDYGAISAWVTEIQPSLLG